MYRNATCIANCLYWCVGVLYFVSTTVNPILYNVLSRKYRQAFTMTLCNACMDDATRQRLQRDGFGMCTVYYSATRASATPLPATVTGDTITSKRRRMWGNAATAVGRPHSLTPVESGTGTTSSSVISPALRASASTGSGVRYRNGVVNVGVDPEACRIRFLASDATVGDGHVGRQLLGDRPAEPRRQTSAARRSADGSWSHADGSRLIEPEELRIEVRPELTDAERCD